MHTCFLQNEGAFLKDYAMSHKKLSELGFRSSSSSSDEVAKNWLTPTEVGVKSLLTPSVVGVAVTAILIVLSYFYEVRRRIN